MEEQKNKKFPFEINDVEPDLAAEMMENFTGEFSGFVQVGPKKYFFPKKFKELASDFYNLPLRDSDVFVVTCPRSGTTCMQELVWLIANGLDFTKAAESSINKRFHHVETSAFYDPTLVKKLVEEYKGDTAKVENIKMAAAPSSERLVQAPSPRFLNSHLPLSLLPPTLLDTTKVVFMARDPRDVAVSFYHHNRLVKLHGYVGNFSTYWSYFMKGRIYYAPIFESIKEGWENRNHPNMLFLFYEDLIKDMPGVVRRVASFLKKELSDAQVERLCEHLKFDNFRNNASVNGMAMEASGIIKKGEQPFIRKGKVGGWREYFDYEMTEQADRWMERNLRDTDLRFSS